MQIDLKYYSICWLKYFFDEYMYIFIKHGPGNVHTA